jgi:hypothetical protein
MFRHHATSSTLAVSSGTSISYLINVRNGK